MFWALAWPVQHESLASSICVNLDQGQPGLHLFKTSLSWQAASEVHALEAAVQLALRSGSASLLSPPLQAFSPLEHDAMLDVLNTQTASMPSTKLALKAVNLYTTKCMADDEAGQSGMIGPSAEFASAPPAAKLVPLPLRHGSRVARRKYRQDQAELKAKW